MTNGPDPSERYPIKEFPRVGFLRNFITDPNIIIGEYTYYDDPDGPENFSKNVLYHYPFTGDKLIIVTDILSHDRLIDSVQLRTVRSTD